MTSRIAAMMNGPSQQKPHESASLVRKALIAIVFVLSICRSCSVSPVIAVEPIIKPKKPDRDIPGQRVAPAAPVDASPQEAAPNRKEVEENRQKKAEEAKRLTDKEAAPNPKEVEENRQKEAEEAKRLTELFLRNQSVFIRKGEFMLELDSFYNRNSRTTLVPIGGGVAVAQQTRRFFDTTVIGRYGLLTDGLELDLIVPAFIHAEQVSDFGVVRGSQDEDGIGDIGAALRYQVWYERGARPALVLDVTGKSRTGGTGLTGTGTWNAGGGITLIKSFDPVVFFGRLGYVYNFASQTRDLGNIIDYRIGMGFSLNDRVSFNIQFTGAYIQPSKVVGTGLAPGGAGFGPVVFTSRHVEIMNLVFTTTVIVTKNFSVEPLVGVGLTNESFTIVGLRLPYRF